MDAVSLGFRGYSDIGVHMYVDYLRTITGWTQCLGIFRGYSDLGVHMYVWLP